MATHGDAPRFFPVGAKCKEQLEERHGTSFPIAFHADVVKLL
jgi:hypothetical protein